MTDILVRPPELRQISEQLKSSANKIGTALQAIDNDILSLKGDKFLGNRANTVQTHYAPKREALIKAKDIVLHFSGDLKAAADVFEKADTQGGIQIDSSVANNLKKFEENWGEMNLDDRKMWLRDWYYDLCKKMGIEPVKFKIKDLFDPPGKDAQGEYNNGIWFGWFKSLSIDIDNVKGNDILSVLKTIAHETQHQYQHFLVEHPEKRPENITMDQINEWEKNSKNYTRPEDDFEGYRNQPLEKNARETADQIINDQFAQGVDVI